MTKTHDELRAEGAKQALDALADDLEDEATIERNRGRGGRAKYLSDDLVPRIRRRGERAVIRVKKEKEAD